MKIRGKFMVVLLAISLLPLLAVTIINNRTTRRMGQDLADGVRALLTDDARAEMVHAAQSLAREMGNSRNALELTLGLQALAIEAQLSRSSPVPAIAPAPLAPEPLAMRLAPEADEALAAKQRERLAGLDQVFHALDLHNPGAFLRHDAVFASGLIVSYPGPRAGDVADPRQSPLYLEAIRTGKMAWRPPRPDPATRAVTLAVAMPLRGQDGQVTGVTMLDLPVARAFHSMLIPEAWRDHAQVLAVFGGADGRLRLLFDKAGSVTGDADADEIEALPLLASDHPVELERMAAELREGRAGLVRMGLAGVDSFWAFAPARHDQLAVVIVLPYEPVIARALEAESLTLRRTLFQLLWNVAIMLAAAGIVAFAAWELSRRITRPITALTTAARRVAGGELDVRVTLRRADELGQLADDFNQMVPKLQDRLHLRESLSMAMQVQQALLPRKLPTLPGLDIAAGSAYCDETGGDYYDFIPVPPLGPHALCVAVGDVAGHGIASALLMTTARALLRSGLRFPGDLAQTLSHVNAQLARDCVAGRFMTLLCLVFDMDQRRAQWLSAGHDAPIVYDPGNDTFAELPGHDIPLGIDGEHVFRAETSPLWGPGTVMVIGTDGVWETRDARGRMFGKDRLRAIMREHRARDAAAIHAAIMEAVREFRGDGPRKDDVTLVVVRVTQA